MTAQDGWSSAGRRGAFVVAVVAAGLLGLAGCSDGGGDVDGPGGSGSEGTAAPTTAPPSTTADRRMARECGQVAFTPASEDAASDIRAVGIDCEGARDFVEVAGRRTSSGGPDEVEVDGWTCRRTASQEDPLPTSTYECTEGDRIVTFVRS